MAPARPLATDPTAADPADDDSTFDSALEWQLPKTAALETIDGRRRRMVRRLDRVTRSLLLLGAIVTAGLVGLRLVESPGLGVAALFLWALAPYGVFAVSMRFERNPFDARVVLALAALATVWGLWSLIDALVLDPAPFATGATLVVVPFVQLIAACICFVFAWIRSYRRRC